MFIHIQKDHFRYWAGDLEYHFGGDKGFIVSVQLNKTEVQTEG